MKLYTVEVSDPEHRHQARQKFRIVRSPLKHYLPGMSVRPLYPSPELAREALAAFRTQNPELTFRVVEVIVIVGSVVEENP